MFDIEKNVKKFIFLKLLLDIKLRSISLERYQSHLYIVYILEGIGSYVWSMSTSLISLPRWLGSDRQQKRSGKTHSGDKRGPTGSLG